MKTLIVFATEKEALETKKKIEQLTSIGAYNICVTGMGPAAVMRTLTDQIHQYDRIINAGVVGSLKNELEVEKHVPIHSVFYQNNLPIPHSSSGYKLLTVDKPLYEHIEGFDLVDMEGYQIASLCQATKKELHFIKIISDTVGPDSSQKIRERLPALSHALYQHITSYIDKLAT